MNETDFPILKREIHGKRLVYLDNAATSQKPKQVLAAIEDYYSNHNANVHRGIHTLSEEATKMYEEARRKIQKLLNARHPEEIIFTRGTTDGINLIASSYVGSNFAPGDSLAVTELEHHSNFLPWMKAAKTFKLNLKIIPVNQDGFIEDFKNDFSQVKLLAFSQASNFLGTIQNSKEIIKKAHKLGALALVDGAQAVPHMRVDVQSLDCDFYAFSGHKMLGPTGIGVLYVKREHLKNLEPYQTGGGMIKEVTLADAVWTDAPERFEAGTPNVEGAIGLGAAVDYMVSLGIDKIREHEQNLLAYAFSELGKIEGVEVYGTNEVSKRTGLISFNVRGIHSHDLASVLDSEGVAIRSGHHCTQPMHTKLKLAASARASFHLYNSQADIDVLIKGILKAKEILL